MRRSVVVLVALVSLTTAAAGPVLARPSEFKTKAGERVYLYVLERMRK
jgi:hypothetical protein